MKRLFQVYNDTDFAEWVEEELAEYGRFIRSLESLDFFLPQWNAVGSVDVIILQETVIKSQDSFMNLYQTVKKESPETIFLLIYHREKDAFLERLLADGNVCISYDELDTGLLEERLRNLKVPTPPPAEKVKPSIKEKPSSPKQDPKGNQKAEETARISRSEPITPNESNESATQVQSPKTRIAPIDEVRVAQTQQIKPESPIEQENDFAKTVMKETHESAAADSKAQKLSIGEGDKSSSSDHKIQSIEPVAESQEESIEESKPVKKRRSSEEQKAKLQRIKERIIIEEKIVTVHVPVHFNSILVSIVSLYPRAGATFVTANFARMLGENKVPVAVLEPVYPNAGSTFYELMYGDKNAPKEWKSWAEQLQTMGYISQENNWSTGGVVWIPANIEPTPNWTEEQTMQLLLAAKRFPVTLCDISSNYAEPHSKKMMSMSDEIWIVTDGDPISLSHHIKTIDNFKNEFPGKTIKVIGNKWNEYIKQSQWKEAVLLPILTQIPDLGSVVLKHLWDGTMAWDDTKLKNILASPFKPMARTVMAKEMYSMIKKQYGLGAKLKGIFSKMRSLSDEATARKY